jgi:hypothetical protein
MIIILLFHKEHLQTSKKKKKASIAKIKKLVHKIPYISNTDLESIKNPIYLSSI